MKSIEYAKLSPCIKRKVGAVVYKDGEVISYGFNHGFYEKCTCSMSEKNPDVLHAEEMALLAVARDSCKGAKIFVNYPPCKKCQNMILNYGISEVVIEMSESDFINIKESGGKYIVNIFGDVKHNRTNKLIKPSLDKSGYVIFTMQGIDGRSFKMKQHRLVMIYFGPNPNDDQRFVNHIDGNKSNNSLSNLEWCTSSENAKHKYHVLGFKPPSRKGVFGGENPQSRKVKATDIKTGEVLFFNGCSDAERKSNGLFYHQLISRCANGKLKSHKGYNCEYI